MTVKSRLAEFGAKLADLQDAYQARLRDYSCLAAAKRHAGAVIMAIFSVEILLKCLICKNIGEQALPRVFQEHDLEGLLIMAGLRSKLQHPRLAKIQYSWTRIREFGERSIEFRYLAEASVIRAADFVQFRMWLEDAKVGVVPWLKRQL